MSELTAYYPPETRVMPMILLRRERLLPADGAILVAPGQRVESSDVVARTEVGGQFRTFEIARLLRVPPARATKYLKKHVGDVIKTGDVLASRPMRQVRSPISGTIVDVDPRDGRVAIEIASKEVELRAYLKGIVGNILGNRGVVVETPGALIQAAWGIGGESYGVLHVVTESADEPLKASLIDVKAHGSVVAGGGWITASALEQAQSLQLRGMIAGSIEGDLIETAMQLPFPIILTEGVGRSAMAAPIFELIRSQEGREVSISAETRMRWGVVRPEILIPLPAETRPPLPPAVGSPLTVGARVRVVRGPYVGSVGTVSAIPSRAQRIETGTRVHGAEVRFSPSSAAFVPFANLELLR
ncbi:MAG TPA: hypothetical protein VJG32_03930 [Anaerolineae bacterium]|nr:hypothetical protein [Anaerolineae bacterium]